MLSYEISALLKTLQDEKIGNTAYQYITYSLETVNFNETTHTLKLVFKKTEKYQTIERYVQQNYVKYPVYSDWKYKHSLINKTLKINNEVLENLRAHSDYLVSKFVYDIIRKLNREDYIPSWAWHDIFNYQERHKIKLLKDKQQKRVLENEEKNKKINSNISNNTRVITVLNNKLVRPIKKLKKINERIEKTRLKWRHSFLQKKRSKKLKKIDDLNSEILLLQKNNENAEMEIAENNTKTNEFIQKIKQQILEITKEFKEKRKAVIKLPTKITDCKSDLSFIKLKNLYTLNYEKITGVYIIKNNENEKYYVGQSKDILKRLKQHFKGTTPANIIFAEDYYSSQNKEDLFSVKIVPLQTKDELDSMEKTLIEQYDSFENGYNKTTGNS